MPSQTGIINNALRAISGTRITSISDGTANGNIATDLWDDAVDALLRAHTWNFATRRIQLARSATLPVFEYDYAYVLPADWIRTISVHDNDDGFGTITWREEINAGQRALLANEENVYLRYVARVTDTNVWAVDFVSAFTAQLASLMAVPVAKSVSLAEKWEKEAGKRLRRARSTDALGASPESRPLGSWVTSREGWR